MHTQYIKIKINLNGTDFDKYNRQKTCFSVETHVRIQNGMSHDLGMSIDTIPARDKAHL